MADAPASGPSPQPRSAAFRCYIIIFLFDKCMSLYLARMCLQKKFIIILCFIGWLQLEFSVRRVQMNFLHLLSAGAEQRITIHCLNVTIWSHAPSEPPSQNAVWFQAWTGETLEPDVLADTCWVSVPFKKLAIIQNTLATFT